MAGVIRQFGSILLSAVLGAVVCVLWVGSAWSGEGRFALVIGSANYKHLPPLNNPTNDAQAMSAKLNAMGFHVDTVVDMDLETIRARIEAFSERASGAEKALIFFAGHGLQVAGENYLLPVNIQLQRPDQLRNEALGVDELFDAFNRAAPETAILILDACRDNPFVGQSNVNQGLASGNGVSITQRPNAAGIVIAYAAAPGAVAFDGQDGNSPYTTALLQWIDRPGIEIATMFRRVRETVVQLTNGNQVPWVEEALVRDVYLGPEQDPAGPIGEPIEVVLLDKIEALGSGNEQDAVQSFYDRYLVNAKAEARAVARPEQDKDEQLVREGLIWLGIRSSDNPEHIRQYLEKFPDGTFSEKANERLEQLTVLAAQPPDAQAWLEVLDPIAAGSAIPASSTGVTGFADSAPARLQTPDVPALQIGDVDSTDEIPEVVPQTPSISPREREDRLALDQGELAAIQVLLRFAGHYNGAIDASYGPGTRGAIRDFQSKHDLLATGHLTQTDLRELISQTAPSVLQDAPTADMASNIHNVAAVAANGPDGEPQVIKVASLEFKPEVTDYLRQVANDFEAMHPGTRVQFSRKPGREYNAQLMALLGSEAPPDILYTWGGGHLRALRDAGFARNIANEMAEDWVFQFKPGALQNYTLDGGIYGAPRHQSMVSLYANRSILAEAGVDLAQLETWDGFLDAVEKLKVQGVTPLAVGGADMWPFHFYFGPLSQQLAGRSGFQAALTGTGEGFAAEPFVQAGTQFQRLADLAPFQSDFAATREDKSIDLFASGQAAMTFAGNWRIDKMQWTWPGGMEAMRDELAILDLPKINASSEVEDQTYGGVEGFVVSTTAPDVAVNFLQELTSIDVQIRISELTSKLPASTGADLALEGTLQGQVANDLLDSSYHQLYLDMAMGPAIRSELNSLLTRVSLGEISGSNAVLSLAAAWQTATSQ